MTERLRPNATVRDYERFAEKKFLEFMYFYMRVYETAIKIVQRSTNKCEKQR